MPDDGRPLHYSYCAVHTQDAVGLRRDAPRRSAFLEKLLLKQRTPGPGGLTPEFSQTSQEEMTLAVSEDCSVSKVLTIQA